MDFTDKAVLITGASRGIGRAIAQEFADLGAEVAVHYNSNETAAEETIKSLPGGPHIAYGCDITNPAGCESLVDYVVKQFGRIDVLVNNAGIYEPHGPLSEIAFDEWLESWRRTLGINLLGPANLIYWAARKMIAQGGGHIVNVTSRGAFRGEPDAPAYGASKAGLNSLGQSMAQALAKHKVYVTAVAPGYVETEMTVKALSGPEGDSIRNQSPTGRVARADEIAHTVVFLASKEAEYLTGAIVDINGASYLRT
jgi:3-oxoacyl-[acyl-carrier protein] reductase